MVAVEAPADEHEVIPAPPESQFSMNWMMTDGYGGNVQITMRAGWIDEWPAVMRERKDFCEKAQQAGWSFPGTVKPTASVPAASSAPVGSVPPPAASGPVPINGSVIQTIKTSSLKVVPRTDGKVDLEFWNPGRNYAEIKAVKTPEHAAQMLAATGAWTPDSFKTAQVYDLLVTIEWTPGKPNSKGNPFKDIQAVRPA